MATKISALHRSSWLVTLLLAAAALPASGLDGPTSPSRVVRIDFENKALPARQKELLWHYADQIVGWASAESLVRAAEEQSAKPNTMEHILEIDRAWQRGGDPQGLVTRLASNECAKTLQSYLAANPGFGEAFVADAQGALVCMSRRTSDYWQGDEAKWTRAWAGGTGAVFVSEISRDESTGLDLMHISVPIRAGSHLVGILTVGRPLGTDAGARSRASSH